MGEVRIVKNCDQGLENAAWNCWLRDAFWSQRSQFFTIQTDPKLAKNIFFSFFCSKLAYNWVCLCNFIIELAYKNCRSNKPFVKNLTSKQVSNSVITDVSKEQIHFGLLFVSCIYSSSPGFFATTKKTSVSHCESLEIRLFFCNQ